MNELDLTRTEEWARIVKETRGSTRSDIEKLAYCFGWITGSICEHTQEEIEIGKAMKDEDTVLKQQIKLAVIKHARSIFQDCHLLATGKKAWDG
jgi:hypothetical protein